MNKPSYHSMPQTFYGTPQIYHQPLRLVTPMPHVVTTEPRRLILTAREEEVMMLLGDAGLDYNQIADRLSISKLTLKKHRENIYFKLGVNSRSEAVSMWRGGEITE